MFLAVSDNMLKHVTEQSTTTHQNTAVCGKGLKSTVVKTVIPLSFAVISSTEHVW